MTVLLPFYALVFQPRGTWDLSSRTSYQTCTYCIARGSLNHRTAKEVLTVPLLIIRCDLYLHRLPVEC